MNRFSLAIVTVVALISGILLGARFAQAAPTQVTEYTRMVATIERGTYVMNLARMCGLRSTRWYTVLQVSMVNYQARMRESLHMQVDVDPIIMRVRDKARSDYPPDSQMHFCVKVAHSDDLRLLDHAYYEITGGYR